MLGDAANGLNLLGDDTAVDCPVKWTPIGIGVVGAADGKLVLIKGG